MKEFTRILWVALSACVLMACASTKLLDHWADPDYSGARLRNVVVFVLDTEETRRRQAEDEYVRRLGAEGVEASAAYTLFTKEEEGDLETLKVRIKELGFDGAIASRLVGVTSDYQWVPGTHYATGPYHAYYGFGSYYSYAYHHVYEPGYMVEEKKVKVETNVYTVTDEKLVWSGLSETFDPTSAVQVIEDVVSLVVKEMKRTALI